MYIENRSEISLRNLKASDFVPWAVILTFFISEFHSIHSFL